MLLSIPTLNFFLHPEWFHKVETLGNHVVELALPVLMLIPHRMARFAGGSVQILFQVQYMRLLCVAQL